MFNKNIYITGGLGYIGMELCKLYSGYSRYNKISVIDNKFYSSRVAQLKKWGINYFQADILNNNALASIIKKPDIVFHLAGITDVATTVEDKDKNNDDLVRKTGILGTKNIISFCNENTKLIFPSTHVIFEGLNKLTKDIDEEFTPLPNLEYSKGKLASEIDIQNSNIKYVILRLGSVFGNSFDSTRFNIMPNLFSKITSESGVIQLFSGGNQLKSLVSIKDVARAMMFVAENQKIENEIFNIVNENLTVKEVANLCKKINPNLTLKKTNNLIPNEGYSLSNKKIKNFGFEFLYSLEQSITEFVTDFSERQQIDSNEKIEIGSNNFVDHRGIISNYYFDDPINVIGYVESKKNTIRGNHYHPIQTQKCLLISGSYISITKDLMKPNSVEETKLIKAGELSIIPPFVAHTMVFLENSVFLNLVTGEREHENYGITHTIKYELVNKDLGNFLLNNYKLDCRVCGNRDLILYLSLGLSPLANNLLNKKNAEFQKFPLEVNFCNKCFNSQLSVVVPASEMFDNYLYLSSTTESFRKHFEELACKLKNDLKLNKSSLVVDIGSNDGIFLKPLKEFGINAIGVEPAKNIALIAENNALKTINSYFNKRTANKIKSEFGSVDLVTGFNVFAHGDNLFEIAQNIEKILKPDGKFIFEVQYLYDTIKELTFDNIYHEHCNYWTVLSLKAFFDKLQLKIYKIERINTHGGSIRVYTSMNVEEKIHPSVNKFLNKEVEAGLNKFTTYKNFGLSVEQVKIKSVIKINKLIAKKRKIIGYGAPAKATTILNYYGLTNLEIEFIVDENPLKQGKFIPGSNIKIIPIDFVDLSKFDYVLVLAWNFFEQIQTKLSTKFTKNQFIKLK